MVLYRTMLYFMTCLLGFLDRPPHLEAQPQGWSGQVYVRWPPCCRSQVRGVGATVLRAAASSARWARRRRPDASLDLCELARVAPLAWSPASWEGGGRGGAGADALAQHAWCRPEPGA